jgi:hypothetical protein
MWPIRRLLCRKGLKMMNISCAFSHPHFPAGKMQNKESGAWPFPKSLQIFGAMRLSERMDSHHFDQIYEFTT